MEQQQAQATTSASAPPPAAAVSRPSTTPPAPSAPAAAKEEAKSAPKSILKPPRKGSKDRVPGLEDGDSDGEWAADGDGEEESAEEKRARLEQMKEEDEARKQRFGQKPKSLFRAEREDERGDGSFRTLTTARATRATATGQERKHAEMPNSLMCLATWSNAMCPAAALLCGQGCCRAKPPARSWPRSAARRRRCRSRWCLARRSTRARLTLGLLLKVCSRRPALAWHSAVLFVNVTLARRHPPQLFSQLLPVHARARSHESGHWAVRELMSNAVFVDFAHKHTLQPLPTPLLPPNFCPRFFFPPTSYLDILASF